MRRFKITSSFNMLLALDKTYGMVLNLFTAPRQMTQEVHITILATK